MPYWVTEQIAVGGAGITPDNWIELVDKYHFAAVLNLRGEHQDTFSAPLPTTYLWLPVLDHADPTPEQLMTGVYFINVTVSALRRILVHCRMGIGRSPTMVAAYLMWRGRSIDDAIQTVTQAGDLIITKPIISRLTLEKFAAYLGNQPSRLA